MWASTGWSVDRKPLATIRPSRTLRRAATRFLLKRTPNVGIGGESIITAHYTLFPRVDKRGQKCRCLRGIAVSRVESKRGAANRDIFRSVRTGSTVADPLAPRCHHSLSGLNIHRTAMVFDP